MSEQKSLNSEGQGKERKFRYAQPKPAQNSRNKMLKLQTLKDLDGRTEAARNAVQMRSAIMVDLGGEERLSTLERLQAENAAMGAIVLRDLHVRWLKGEQVSVAEMTALENTFNRTAAALGTARRAKDVMTIDAYLNKGE